MQLQGKKKEIQNKKKYEGNFKKLKKIEKTLILADVQRSQNLRKFPQIFAVSMGVVLGITRILCIPFKILLLS